MVAFPATSMPNVKVSGEVMLKVEPASSVRPGAPRVSAAPTDRVAPLSTVSDATLAALTISASPWGM